jgi:hypothetical protein
MTFSVFSLGLLMVPMLMRPMSTLRRVFLGVLAGSALWAAGLMQPAVSRACLPYDPASDFSFAQGVEFAVLGTVTDVVERAGLGEPRVGVVVAVTRVVAGHDRATVLIGLDPDGGCGRPPGDVGDRLVIARGLPGPDYGPHHSELGMQLSSYNTAIWVIQPGGRVASGPVLDGWRPQTLTALLQRLASLPNTALPAPRWPMSELGWILVIGALAWIGVRRLHHAR